MSDPKLVLILDAVKDIKFKLNQGDFRLKRLKENLDELSAKIQTVVTKEKLKNMIHAAIVGKEIDEDDEDDDEEVPCPDCDYTDCKCVVDEDYFTLVEKQVNQLVHGTWDIITPEDINEMLEDCLYNDTVQGKLVVKTITGKIESLEDKFENLENKIDCDIETIREQIDEGFKRVKYQGDEV